MADRDTLGVGQQTVLGCIGCRFGGMYQNVVPRLLTGWLRLVCLVPLRRCQAPHIERDDHAPIVVATMPNEGSGRIKWFRIGKLNHAFYLRFVLLCSHIGPVLGAAHRLLPRAVAVFPFRCLQLRFKNTIALPKSGNFIEILPEPNGESR
jgi:hypothetical protein